MKLQQLCLLFSVASGVAATAKVSRDGSCGGRKGQTCLKSQFGNCCSQYGYCGDTLAYCGSGCQSRYGTCKSSNPGVSTSSRRPTTTSTSSIRAPSSTPPSGLKVSTDGKCAKGVTCLGSKFGSCCSEHGYCGSSKEYCKGGCQPAFGSCTEQSVGDVSTNGQCGGSQGIICTGSIFGDCCSQYSYCGSTSAYCGKGCQSTFGKCNVELSSSVSSSTTPSASSSSSMSSAEETSTSSSSTSSDEGTSTSSSSSESSAEPTSTESSSSTSKTSSEASTTTTSEEPTSVAASTTTDSTTSSTSSASPTPSLPCRNVPECPNIEGPLTNCPAVSGGCTRSSSGSKYFAQCSRAPAAGAGTLLSQLGARVAGGAGCADACDASSACVGFVFSATSPVGQLCDLYSRIDAFSVSFVNTFVRVCEAPPAEPSMTSAAPSTTETSTSSVEPSSTSTTLVAPAPTCAQNFVSNGGFENDLAPFTVNVVSGSASLSLRGGSNLIVGPKSGTTYLQINTVASPIVTLTQQLTNLRAGDQVQCTAAYVYPGDGDALLEAVQVVMYIDGQFCGQDQSFDTFDWAQVPSSGPITIVNDNPVFQITTYFDNFFGYSLTAGLDAIAVIKAGDAGKEVCQ